jgi:hypothetical protein
MAVAWGVQFTLIAVRGEICLTETNAGILYGQTVAAVLVVLPAVFVLVLRHGRLTEKRNRDSRQDRPWEPERLQILDPR